MLATLQRRKSQHREQSHNVDGKGRGKGEDAKIDDDERYGSGMEPGADNVDEAGAEMVLDAPVAEEDIQVSDEEADQVKEAQDD